MGTMMNEQADAETVDTETSIWDARPAASELAPLSVHGVTKSFGGGWSPASMLPWSRAKADGKKAAGPRRVVDHVSLEVRRGEIFGVIGANGSGKSTLIRMISTLLLPDEGDVRVFGYDAVKDAMKVRALINRVSADPSFFKSMTALENLLFFGRVYGLAPERDQASDAGDPRSASGSSGSAAIEPMSHLSRGQQQKVAVARAFLTSPVLMLLDEPTTGLDPRSKRDVQAFIEEVRRDHDATILLTTHDMEEAELLCDRIAFISGGKIVAEGTPLELREQVARRPRRRGDRHGGRLHGDHRQGHRGGRGRVVSELQTARMALTTTTGLDHGNGAQPMPMPRRLAAGAGVGVHRAADEPVEALLGVGAGVAGVRRGEHAGRHVHRHAGRRERASRTQAQVERAGAVPADRHAGLGVPVGGARRHLAGDLVGALGRDDRAHADGAGRALAAPGRAWCCSASCTR